MLEQADTVDYVSRDYYDGCMIDRNHRLVDSPALLLAVYNGMRRIGTSATVNYARKMGLEIIVIGPITRHITHEEAAPSLANLWRCILCCNLSARMCRNQRPQGAENHAVRRVRPDAERPVRGLGEPQQAHRDIENDIPMPCLCEIIEVFSGSQICLDTATVGAENLFVPADTYLIQSSTFISCVLSGPMFPSNF